MRWLRFFGLVIFVFLTAWAIPIAISFPTFSNIIITIIFIGIDLWIGSVWWMKLFRQKGQYNQYGQPQPIFQNQFGGQQFQGVFI